MFYNIHYLQTRFPFDVVKTIILCETVASLSPVLANRCSVNVHFCGPAHILQQ